MAVVELRRTEICTALAMLEEAVGWQRKALAKHPGHPMYRQFLRNHLMGVIQAGVGLHRADVSEQAPRAGRTCAA